MDDLKVRKGERYIIRKTKGEWVVCKIIKWPGQEAEVHFSQEVYRNGKWADRKLMGLTASQFFGGLRSGNVIKIKPEQNKSETYSH